MINLDYIKKHNLIIFDAISGSHAYGTATPSSDLDIRGVFVLPKEEIFGLGYIEQVNDQKNDIVYYEVRRFLELVASNNPNILELLNTPEDCIRYKHPVFDLILKNSDKFITKQCRNSFAGYARQQINKAEGMNKMQNWEAKRVARKTPIDFCYVIDGYKTRSLKTVLREKGWRQENCGLSAINHARDTYALFYDKKQNLGYKGIQSSTHQDNPGKSSKGLEGSVEFLTESLVKESHKVRLSSIPKGQKHEFIITYNEDGYSSHCKDYKRYQTWKKERNKSRWTDVKAHGQQIDGKNMLHCRRLLDMAKEIAQGKGINVRRPNAKELLSIRKGEIKLRQLLNQANAEIKEIDSLFINSNLPELVDMNFVHNLLIQVRTEFYESHTIAH